MPSCALRRRTNSITSSTRLGSPPRQRITSSLVSKFGIGADRDVRKLLLDLFHQRVEARLDRKHETQLANGRGRTVSEKLRLELFGENALELQGHPGQDEDPLALPLVDDAWRHAALVLEHVQRSVRNARPTQVSLGGGR